MSLREGPTGQRTSHLAAVSSETVAVPTVGEVVRPRSRWKRWQPTLLALLGSLGLASLYARVALLHLGEGVVGGNVDGFQNLWNDYWTRTALVAGHSPFFTDVIYYPSGTSLRFHTLHPLTGLLAIGLWPLIGWVASTNLFFWLSLVSTNFFAYLLIRDWVENPLAAFGGAALFTYASELVFSFYANGETEKLAVQWLPLYLFFMFRLVYRPRRSLLYGLAAVGTLLAMSLTDWQYTMYAVLTTLLFFGYCLFTKPTWVAKRLIFFKLAAVGLGWGVLVGLPLLLPMFNEAAKSPWLANVSRESVFHSLDAAFFWLPNSNFESLTPTNPGYLALIVVGLGLVTAWRSPTLTDREGVRFWTLCGGLAWLLALGSRLVVAGNVTEVPLPYALFTKLPVTSAGRDPVRFYSLTLLAFGVLFAFGLAALMRRSWPLFLRLKPFWLGSGLAVGLTGVVLAGFMIHSGGVAVDALDVPPFYGQLGQDTRQYAILELPLFTDNGRGEDVYQTYQVVHHKERLGGRLARDRKLSNPNNFAKRETYIRDFFWLSRPQQTLFRPTKDILPTPDFATLGRPLLNYWNIRYIVIWKEALLDPKGLEANRQLVRTALGSVKPTYEDSRMEAYAVPDGPPLPADKRVVPDIGGGWSSSEADSNGLFRWADPQADVSGEIYLTNLSDQPARVTLHYKLFSFVPAGKTAPRTVRVAIDDYQAASYDFGPSGDLKDLSLELTVPPGFHVLTFATPQPAQPANPNPVVDARTLTFGLKDLTLTVNP